MPRVSVYGECEEYFRNMYFTDDGTGEPSLSSLSDLGDNLLSEIGSLKSISKPHEFDITPAQVRHFFPLCKGHAKP